ncbi:hypothetical protein [Suttonella ornithocola]|uniref:DUF2262 domain-containing protein n=1 Tax=Suttonella ornithocola TaxID=279832 RepID=A0A380MZ98_9GAMM|nr:hypothetical protein [Suttonella ornithocola]SUO97885.1 Uncharacterised protein [Suttonella ornithocola]
MKTLQDTILGDLKFDYGWRKSIEICGQHLEAIFDAFDEEQPTDAQRKSYQSFIGEQEEYLKKASQTLKEYQKSHTDAEGNIYYTAIYFARNGDYGILANCDWDPENGIAILLFPEIQVTEQDRLI